MGGKVLLFQATLPSVGAGRLRTRADDARVYGTEREHVIRGPEDTFYKKIAADFSRVQMSVDVFSFSSKFADLASLGGLGWNGFR